MFRKWWSPLEGENEEEKTKKKEKMRETEENARLACGAVVPLLLADDSMRIYFRRSKMSKTLTSAIAAATSDASAAGDTPPQPTVSTNKISTATVVVVLSALAAGCRNRLVQEEFVSASGLDHVTTMLRSAVVVDEAKRSQSSTDMIQMESGKLSTDVG
jgi:hypothetical protein